MSQNIRPAAATHQYERALSLVDLLIERATSSGGDLQHYLDLRREFISDDTLRDELPGYVRSCRSLDAFWPVAKAMCGTWEGRRVQIRQDFSRLLDRLEGGTRAPLDADTEATLGSFSEGGVLAVWQKALTRRSADPEGAITTARTLLEAVCKHILEEGGVSWRPGEPLPKLYGKTAKLLNLTPDTHSAEAIQTILTACSDLVGGLGNLRNSFSDAHAPEPTPGRRPVRPTARHAQLAVNLAGAMATFLVETWLLRKDDSGARLTAA